MSFVTLVGEVCKSGSGHFSSSSTMRGFHTLGPHAHKSCLLWGVECINVTYFGLLGAPETRRLRILLGAAHRADENPAGPETHAYIRILITYGIA